MSDEPVEMILEAAADEFAEQGFSGARMDRIAERAGVNKSTIYYHVGDKEELYTNVFVEILESVGDRFDEISDGIKESTDPIEKTLRSMLRDVAEHLTERSHYRIILSDIVIGERNIPEEAFQQALANAKIFKSVYDQGKQEGVFREDASPLTTYLMFFSSVLFFSAMRSEILRVSDFMGDTLGRNLDKDTVPPELLDLIFEGILARNGGHDTQE